MKLILIAAHDPNLVIGSNGELPWHYSEDLKFFKKQTMGHPIVMGRVVFEELNEKPLPGRENIVLSRSRTYDHVKTFSDIDSALSYLSDRESVFIIGGGEIYRQTLPMADRLIITRIRQEYEGDTTFPEYRDDIGSIWKETWREEHSDFDFIIYDRI
ncbi:dihydrofolate reductase [Rhodohalobacter mucosus]|uniref:Dihydrofolate reductase n=1 Tax=Rhodohalobacter mucosus TaxID=2079485 RepID=A0A316TXN7_9BACT|nr:dihydrofolate reductase [Rhodohalobacter mucosus]PWN07442.1 dihydrofolate reductase [Rhodohalobacter mucosus]